MDNTIKHIINNALKNNNLELKDQNGFTPLMLAIIHYPKKVKPLIKINANINSRNNEGQTPLMLAVRKCHKMVPFLLKSGADPTLIDNMNNNLLSLAIIGKYSKAKKFINLVKDVNQKNTHGRSPIIFAAQHLPSIIPDLIKSGVDLNVKDNDGETVLYTALHYKRNESLDSLLRAGVDVQPILQSTMPIDDKIKKELNKAIILNEKKEIKSELKKKEIKSELKKKEPSKIKTL